MKREAEENDGNNWEVVRVISEERSGKWVFEKWKFRIEKWSFRIEGILL